MQEDWRDAKTIEPEDRQACLIYTDVPHYDIVVHAARYFKGYGWCARVRGITYLYTHGTVDGWKPFAEK